MDWTDQTPKESGYYFLDDCGDEIMVEVFMSLHGPRYIEPGRNEFIDCADITQGEWLGPVKAEDIINLWKYFNDKRRK